jgi:hypothetical protein
MKQLSKICGCVACFFLIVFLGALGSSPVMAKVDCDKNPNHPTCPENPDDPPPPPDPDPVDGPNHALAINGFERKLDIVAIDADGGNPTQVVRNASGHPMSAGPTVWTADGARIVWSDLSYSNLQMVDADGSNRLEILTATNEVQYKIGGQRNLAPSGFDCDGNEASLLYFLARLTDVPGDFSDSNVQEEFFVMDLNDLAVPPVRLTTDEVNRHTTLDVSPDGQFIATWTFQGDGMNYDDPEARFEIRDACAEGLPVLSSWTAEDLQLPDGNLYFARIDWSVEDILAVSGFSDGPDSGDLVEDIHLIDLFPESGAVKVEKIIGSEMPFGDGVNNRRATWSPDGTQLAFTSDHDVYILDTLTGDIAPVAWFKLNRDIDWRPTWVADP